MCVRRRSVLETPASQLSSSSLALNLCIAARDTEECTRLERRDTREPADRDLRVTHGLTLDYGFIKMSLSQCACEIGGATRAVADGACRVG